MPTKVYLVKAIVFPVVMYGCESWTIKKAEHQRIDAFFELWCCRRLLRVPWTSKRSNQSVLKEISPEYSLEELLKLKVQYFGQPQCKEPTHWEKTLMLGKINSRKSREWQRMRWLDGITNSMDISFEQAPGDGEGQRRLACCSPWGHKGLDMTDWMNTKGDSY